VQRAHAITTLEGSAGAGPYRSQGLLIGATFGVPCARMNTSRALAWVVEGFTAPFPQIAGSGEAAVSGLDCKGPLRGAKHRAGRPGRVCAGRGIAYLAARLAQQGVCVPGRRAPRCPRRWRPARARPFPPPRGSCASPGRSSRW
jgi:hypothetical protein